jgi:SPP1 gp7 family putative phage head morphogenesis protein
MDKTDPAVLLALFGQPPEQAIAYLKSKGLRLTFNWKEMLDEAHARAFTVAKVMRLDILRDIRTGLLGALKDGKTLSQFEKELTPLLQSKGWWGKQLVQGNNGELEVAQLGSPHRLKTIYQTNMQSAFMAGRKRAQLEADAFPYLMYVAVMDSRTRPSHAALNGKIWRKDDRVWATISPPNGFNCRCRTRALTPGQLKREGLSVSDSPEIVSREQPDGSIQKGVTVQSANGKPITMWVDTGFDSSPLAGHPMDELLRQKAVAAVGERAAYELVQKTVLSDTRMKAWAGFVENTFDSGVENPTGRAAVQNQTMTVGVMPLSAVSAFLQVKLPVSPVLYVDDTLIVGKKAVRHEAAANALTREEWMSLPQALTKASLYFEPATKNLIYIWEADETTAFKAVFDANGQMDTAYRDRLDTIERKMRSGAWKPIK